MGGGNGPGPASRAVIASDHGGSETASPSRRRSHSLSLYDGKPYRHALGVRAGNAGYKWTVLRKPEGCRSVLASGCQDGFRKRFEARRKPQQRLKTTERPRPTTQQTSPA